MADYAVEEVTLRWDLNPEEISNLTKEVIEKSRKVYDNVGSLKAEEVTIENCLQALANDERDFTNSKAALEFLQHISTDKEVRAASTEADRIISEFGVEMRYPKDRFCNYHISLQDRSKSLSAESKRLLERLIKLGKRNGLHLPSDVQEEITAIKKKQSDVSIKFNSNLNEENTKLTFDLSDLAGLPDDFIKSLEKDNEGKYVMTLKYPHYVPCMRKASNPETRRRLEYAFNRRCIEENTKILEELVELRQRCKSLGYKFDGKINYWDMRYYMTMVEEKNYAVDQEKLKEYFPLDVVTKGLHFCYGSKLYQTNRRQTIITHTQRDGSAIPDEMLDKLIASRNANTGLFNSRQIMLATFDQKIHTTPKADTAKVYAETSERILHIPATPDTNMSASFGHLAGGYDAQYYGYLWSEVFCMDMFHSRFKKEGIMEPKVGMDYRTYILQPGGSLVSDVGVIVNRRPNQCAGESMCSTAHSATGTPP
ncbi:hypothetical protein QZH41_017596 [Actinostola sp. cb2023]|nr:hypothetical protein QZH41_017596 [Actinostola sp. cb2023]